MSERRGAVVPGPSEATDGPTWCYGMPDPTAGSPLGALSRRAAVLALSNHAPGAAR